ncbi:MAG: BREX-6 system adenine-specific DNA-methyltransferase PglX [Lysobacterales bacterium]
MPMTSEAKTALRNTIRALRARLLEDLHNSTESAYRMLVRARDAGLSAAARARRGRLELWMDEQVRAQGDVRQLRTREDFRREAEKQAAYTWLNRVLILRLMEAPVSGGKPMRAPPVVTGGWESQGYKEFRDVAPALVRGDDSEGYAFLLQLVFEDLAEELPGLYGSAGAAELIPMAPSTLRHLVDALNQPALVSCWTDDMTLGWVYQYWNDPEREALDAKLNAGGKLAPHEISSKTQMFTERYMVDWLLQNSLGPMWLAMCKRHGWTPEVEADGTLQRLEERRVDWRAKRDASEVSLTELMPLHTDAERRWAYYLPQPIPDDAVTHAPVSVRDLKIIDPALGSGHFLVVALDLLVALYREEARHRSTVGHVDRSAGYVTPDPPDEPSAAARDERKVTYDPAQWTDRAIVERILSHNLHGIDLDPRAVQIAAAALWLKARQIAPDAQPERLNLVASNLRLASLPDDDPALVELRREVERETGIPGEITLSLVHALRGADHLGSLLKVDHAVEEALNRLEWAQGGSVEPAQVDLFKPAPAQQRTLLLERAVAKQSLLDRLEQFLSRHTGGDDLGLRLRGEQLAAGVRFVRLVRGGSYDLVVANPPYQGTAKMADSKYIELRYPTGKADLYAAFLLRGLELARAGGASAMLTMRNWMFIKQFSDLREVLLGFFDFRVLGDFDRGAFEDIPDEVVSVAASVTFRRTPQNRSWVTCPTAREDSARDSARTQRKRAASLVHLGASEFKLMALRVVPEWPVVYWWDEALLRAYEQMPLMEVVAPARQGLITGDMARFLRTASEVACIDFSQRTNGSWVPYVMGAKGKVWCEPASVVVRWSHLGLEVQSFQRGGRQASRPQNQDHYFQIGVAFSMIGSTFNARVHRYPSIFGGKGSSVFPMDIPSTVCWMNSFRARFVLQSLNPGIGFEVGDVNRLPMMSIDQADDIFLVVKLAFSGHEVHREPSVEFKQPGPSPWRHAQAWAQLAVDRPEGDPLPPYEPEYDAEPLTDHLSYALGVALGRFGPNGEGILDPAKDDQSHALPGGILFLDGTQEGDDRRDSLGEAAAAPLHAAWAEHGAATAARKTLREWLSRDFFKDVHRTMYENRPIHWPLSSADRTFVAWINIHRFNGQTLSLLLADHLDPLRRRLDGELTDLRAARDGGGDKKSMREAERRHGELLGAVKELAEFIALVEQCAECGPPPTDARCPPRDLDARYDPDLDDGVMINSAALWPLLDPQWKDPKKWWKELASAQGKKDYDWSHLAMRYWPTRVDNKCQDEPSLGVAHGCFWRYHPARAWAWELRLQDEIGPDFRITETPYRPGGRDVGDPGDHFHRQIWLLEHPTEALAAVEREALRRMGRGSKRKPVPEVRILEAGLWSTMPLEIWDMEMRLIEKQGVDFQLRSPDESEARAALVAGLPELVTAREQRLLELEEQRDLLSAQEGETEGAEIDDDLDLGDPEVDG